MTNMSAPTIPAGFIIKVLRLADTFGGGPGIVFTNGEDKTGTSRESWISV